MTYNFSRISLDWKLHADFKTGVRIEKQAKIDQVMGPQTLLTLEKILFEPKRACPVYGTPSVH